MKELNTSLLREKFVIHDPHTDASSDKQTVIASSNRIVLDFTSIDTESDDIFVVRTQNMHSCVRMASCLVQTFQKLGPILNRQEPFDWNEAWESTVNKYEYEYNPQRWVAIYHEGRPIFERGMRHPLLDVIEKCDEQNSGEYDLSIPMAEQAFKDAGKVVSIEYDGNIALVVHIEPKEGRIGVIVRGPSRTTTFNFSIVAGEDRTLSFPQVLATSSCFLEGIQIAFMVGFNEKKLKLGIIEKYSEEEKQTIAAKKRLATLNTEIAYLESRYNVNYRPERPEFSQIIVEAEKLAETILTPPADDEEDEEEA